MLGKKSEKIRIVFTLKQLEEMRSKLYEVIREVDVTDDIIDEDLCELHMDFFLEKNGKKMIVCDRQCDGVSYSYHGSDYVRF